MSARPSHISLTATARLLGVDVARVHRLARAGKLGKVIYPRVPGEEAAVPVDAIERFALRIFSEAQLHRATHPSAYDLEKQAFINVYPPRRGHSPYGI